MMRGGRLRHRLAVQRQNSAPDAYGEDTGTWSEIVQTRGDVEPLQGKELWEAQKATAEVTHRITMRYGVDVLPEDRVINTTGAAHVTYEVTAVINVAQRNRELQVMCVERL